MATNNPLFRPPGEADSLILQVDRGCPHNRCTFCGMYRSKRYHRLSQDQIEALIADEVRMNRGAQRIFLADGDVMRWTFEDLHKTLMILNECFPELARVSLYANGSSIGGKSVEQLLVLRSLKLHTLYMGLESGDEVILARCNKGETALQMIEAGVMAQRAGLRMSVMVLLGLGGVDGSKAHAEHTAMALNRMQPRLLSSLRMIPVPGTEIHEQVTRGVFRQLTEWEVVRELRDIIDQTELHSTVFRANHSSNVAMLEGRLPRDKDRLLAELNSLLASGSLDKRSPGTMPFML